MQPLIVKKRELAAALNLSERRVTDLIAAKTLPARCSTGFDLVRSVQGYLRFLKSNAGGLTTDRARLTKAQADMAELKYREREGELGDLALIRTGIEDIFLHQRTLLMAIPAQIGREIDDAMVRVRVVEVVDKTVRETLEALSNYDPCGDMSDEGEDGARARPIRAARTPCPERQSRGRAPRSREIIQPEPRGPEGRGPSRDRMSND